MNVVFPLKFYEKGKKKQFLIIHVLDLKKKKIAFAYAEIKFNSN